ncbi:MAG: hypothetical protein KGO02_12645, partial [Alphaproteobacteria bacterium]|nr:hypothetical protein [Alphaproteobacteria bacterium]
EYWVGFAAMQAGNNASAEAMFRKYYASAVKLAAMNPHDFDWQKEVAYGLQAVSVMDKKLGRTAGAERGMQQQLAMYHAWLKQRPKDTELRFEAGNVVSWLGSLALEQGRLDVAERYFEEQVRDLQQNMAAEPANVTWKDKSVDALAWLEDVQEQRGELEQARVSAASATALAAALYARDPENNDWRATLAACHLKESELTVANQPDKSTHEAEVSMSLLAVAHAKDPKNLFVMRVLANTHDQLARLALSHGNPARASQEIASSLALLESVWNDRSDEDTRLDYARALLLQGAIAQRKLRARDAGDALTKALELLVPTSQPEIPFDRLDLLVRVLQRLGRASEAAPYLQRLTAAGYVPLYPWPDATSALADTSRSRRMHGSNAR